MTLTEQETNQLAEEITELALQWSEGDLELLRQAGRILARTRYLEGEE